MEDKKSSEKISAYLLKLFTKWINEYDSRAVIMWEFYKPYINPDHQIQIVNKFEEKLHLSRDESVDDPPDFSYVDELFDSIEEQTHD